MNILLTKLEKIITEKIQNTGVIGFDEFMDLALYHRKYGYYRNTHHKIGASGDFITAPHTSDLFGATLAKQIAEIIKLQQQESAYNILEFGAGTGVMAAQMLLYLAKIEQLPEKYYILEVSDDLKQWQMQNIKSALPEIFDRVVWLGELPKQFNGVMIGNEVLDAMPAKRAIIKDECFYELGVGLDENNNFIWQKLTNTLDAKKYDLPDGYISEFNVNNQNFITSLANITGKWSSIFIDYGFNNSEFFHPDRISGTLRCYKNHKADDNPFVDIGSKDITTWVNFSSIANSMKHNGLNVLGYATQGLFLISLKIEQFLSEEQNSDAKIQLASEIKQLVFPNAMGESFKVIICSNNLNNTQLTGFREQNLLAQLF